MAYIGKEPASGIRNRFSYTATAGQTTFSGADDENRTLSYTDAHFTDVFLNGVKLDKSDYTATSGTSIVLDEGAAVGDVLEVLAFDTFSVFSGDFSADVTVGGTLDVQGGELILDADGDTSITSDTDDQIDFKTGGTDRMRISSAGELGLGVTNTTGGAGDINMKGSQAIRWMHATNGTQYGDMYVDTSNNVVFRNTSSSTERMRIDSSGRVGIGTSSPSSYDSRGNNLVVGDSGDAGITIFSGSTSNARLQFAPSGATGLDNGLIDYDNNNDKMSFATAGTDRLVIDSSGNVLVGTTTAGISNSLSTTIETSGYNNSRIYVNHSSGGSSNNSLYMGFGYGGNTIGSIRQNSTTSVSYLTTSDYRLKENAVAISDGITRVKLLQPKRFNFIADDSTTVDGFMAHEAATVVPEAIGGTHNEVETWTQDEIDAGDAPANTSAGDNKLDGDGNTIPVYQGIDQAKLVPLLTAALQEAITKIETLETKVAALEAN